MTALHGFWLTVYTVIVYFAWIGSLSFPLYYGIFKPWYKTTMGRHIFAFSTVIATAMTLLAIVPVFGAQPWRPAAGIVVVLAIGVVSWWRLYLAVKLGRRDRERDEDDG